MGAIFQSHRPLPSLWKGKGENSSTKASVATLPLAVFESADLIPSIDAEKQRTLLQETIANLKACLLGARRAAVLARSRSTPMSQRQNLCREAMDSYGRARSLLNDLRCIARHLTTQERRKVRAIEGAPEWRSIHHAIRRSGELNAVPNCFAA